MYILLLLGMSTDSLVKWKMAGLYNDQSLDLLDATTASGDAAVKERYDRFKGGKSIILQGPLLRLSIDR